MSFSTSARASTSSATSNTTSTLGNVIPTHVTNTTSSSTILPFYYPQNHTLPHSNPVYIILPVVIGLICVLSLAGVCCFIRHKRRQGKRGWWSKEEGTEMGYEFSSGRARNQVLLYKHSSENMGGGVRGIESWRKKVGKGGAVEAVYENEGGNVVLHGSEGLRVFPISAKNKDVRKTPSQKSKWASNEGEEEGEATGMLAANLAISTEVGVTRGDVGNDLDKNVKPTVLLRSDDL